jgi:hemoglobin
MRTLLLIPALFLVAAADPPEQPVEPYTQSNANAGTTPLRSDAAFKAFHGTDGLKRIAGDLVEFSHADPRITDIFRTADNARLKRTLAEQFCYILGGGCAYTRRDMVSIHKDMGLQNADMGALVENLERAMEKEKVPFWAQAKLLAKLAPMKRVVVVR